ncbi:hypothetical protein OH799_19440 [Nocardia sp. NBC_00881]|uniref:hypothetical protein n=1 Tax=Nocardia sp. NBC_00881 TaxID=2975995 RepID=UPI00386C2825|nr:hypothetical protein OH799_19440 [Nocardia sp. NBC_00881]
MTLVDVAEEDNGYGVYEALEVPFPGYPAPGGLLRWGGNYNGDMLCWLTEGEDPDDWPVVVVFRHIRDPSCGGMSLHCLPSRLAPDPGRRRGAYASAIPRGQTPLAHQLSVGGPSVMKIVRRSTPGAVSAKKFR